MRTFTLASLPLRLYSHRGQQLNHQAPLRVKQFQIRYFLTFHCPPFSLNDAVVAEKVRYIKVT